MSPGARRTRPQPAALLAVATEVLVAHPRASLSEVAASSKIGRTTLHKRFPSRHDLLVALAGDALDRLEAVYDAAELDSPGHRAVGVMTNLVESLVPLGAQMAFLTRERSLDDEAALLDRVDALDERLRTLVRRAQEDGPIRHDLPDGWVVAHLNALVYAAWELIELGRLAPVAAPALVMDGLLRGVAVTSDGDAP